MIVLNNFTINNMWINENLETVLTSKYSPKKKTRKNTR